MTALTENTDVPNFSNVEKILCNCRRCVSTKSKWSSHLGKRTPPQCKLEVISTDVLDLTTGPSILNEKLIVSFHDVFSNYSIAYLIEKKDEIPRLFANFHKWMDNQFKDFPIAYLWPDNAAEYIKGDLEQYCFQSGIDIDSGIPYVPELHGHAENKNDIILTQMRCLLEEAGLKSIYWPYALQVAIYLINRTPLKALNFHTPFEVLYGKRPTMKNIRVFGSLAMAHILKEICAKVVKQPKSKETNRNLLPAQDPGKKNKRGHSDTKLTMRAREYIFVTYLRSGYELYYRQLDDFKHRYNMV